MSGDTKAIFEDVPLERESLIDVALGYEPADTVIKHGAIVNVHAGIIQTGGVAIKGSRIAAVGDIEYAIGQKTTVIDAAGQYLVPGLIDPHTHQWHTYLNPTTFAASSLLHGSTAVADGFYGQAIVSGIKAVRFSLDELLATPLKPIFLVPIASYIQNRPLGLPASPNAPTIKQLFEMLSWPETKGIEETGSQLILQRESRQRGLIALLEECMDRGKVVTGHYPGGKDERHINAWASAGPMNNHECITASEAALQARLGIYILIREGSAMTDVRQVLSTITESGYSTRAFQLCTDATSPNWIMEFGQMDHVVRVAIKSGLDSIKAIQMSTIQPAEFYRVNHDIGSIAPGRIADIVFVKDLGNFSISKVMANGLLWVEEGKLIREMKQPEYPRWMYETMNIDRVIGANDFRIPVPNSCGQNINVRVINVRDGLIETPQSIEILPVEENSVKADPASGINKIAMIDRIHGTGELGVGFIRGFNIREGCIGATANCFNQNIVLIGASDEDMAFAADEIIKMGGGFIAVRRQHVVASFPTPLFGINTDLALEQAFESERNLITAWREMGCFLEAPQFNLETSCLVRVPGLRICTRGLALVGEAGDRYELVNVIA